jgi:DNA primase
MRGAAGEVVGIRLRRPDGFKFAVQGGREGLFLPATAGDGYSPLYVCEGPTDAAALLDMGFRSVVGRPSCTGGVKLLIELVRRRRPLEVVIVADGDEPGRRGADNLASVLVAYASAVRVVAPPAGVKDVRDWLRAGGGRQDVEAAIQAAPVRRLAIRAAVKSTQSR